MPGKSASCIKFSAFHASPASTAKVERHHDFIIQFLKFFLSGITPGCLAPHFIRFLHSSDVTPSKWSRGPFIFYLGPPFHATLLPATFHQYLSLFRIPRRPCPPTPPSPPGLGSPENILPKIPPSSLFLIKHLI